MGVDDVDRRVLSALLRNGRASADELGDVADVTDRTAAWRRHTLEDDGVIRSYRPRLDYDLLGYDVTAVLRLEVADDQDAVVAELCDHERVLSVYEVAGPEDVVAVARFADADDLDRLLGSYRTDDRVRAARADTGRTVKEYEQFPPESGE
jgi:DNA-binding Lrp family transcriptional regulator